MAELQESARLTRGRIDPSKIIRSVGNPGAGAVVIFLGTVRNSGEAGQVERMKYEAYAPMAEKRLALAEEEVKRRWPATRAVKIVHRVGDLEVGEVSVAVAVSSPHRAEAFEACRHAIETIKRDVPMWKREKLAGGREVWVEGSAIGPETGTEGMTKRTTKRRASGRRVGRLQGT